MTGPLPNAAAASAASSSPSTTAEAVAEFGAVPGSVPGAVSLCEPPLFTALAPATSVLVAGAGGGFDVYAGLPLAVALATAGKRVHLANLTFADLHQLADEDWLAAGVAAVGPASVGDAKYFPERSLARWLTDHPSAGLAPLVYTFDRVGVQPLRAAWRALLDRVAVDAIVLVDGGTDILMRGDEAGLGTPEEDMASLATVAGLDVPIRVVTCLGFGIDAYHGVCHAQVLENIAALDRDGAYLGALSIPAASVEARAYLDAVDRARAETPGRPSIVNGQIAAAVAGDFGDVQFTRRTSNSQLFVNPLMAMYFSFDLLGLAKHSLYLDRLEHTHTYADIQQVIEDFRAGVASRPYRPLPH